MAEEEREKIPDEPPGRIPGVLSDPWPLPLYPTGLKKGPWFAPPDLIPPALLGQV